MTTDDSEPASTEAQAPPLAAPSEGSTRRLAFIRYLFHQASAQSRQAWPLNAAAILSLHDAVELFVALVAEGLNVQPPNRRPAFLEYFDLIAPRVPPRGLHEASSIKRLNSARVELKHNGTMPAAEAISDFRERVAVFFGDNTPLVFGLDFEAISLSGLITQPRVREYLLQAEQQAEAGQADQALQCLAAAFEWGVMGRAASFSSLVRIPHLYGPLRDEPEMPAVMEAISDMATCLHSLDQEVRLLGFGVDTRRLALFREVAPGVHILSGNKVTFYPARRKVEAAAVYRFCHEFVIDTMLTVQSWDAGASSLPAMGGY